MKAIKRIMVRSRMYIMNVLGLLFVFNCLYLAKIIREEIHVVRGISGALRVSSIIVEDIKDGSKVCEGSSSRVDVVRIKRVKIDKIHSTFLLGRSRSKNIVGRIIFSIVWVW